jgi:putative transposase
MPDYHQPLIPGESYHLFSRAVGNEKLFLSDENYRYFLARLHYHISPVAELYTYSFLPNHFHLVVRIRQLVEIAAYYELVKQKPFHPIETNLPDFIMERFSNWLNGYTKAFNKMYHRKGALFMDYMKRNQAVDASVLASFIYYTHKNAVHHGLEKQIGSWPFDAYTILLSVAPTQLLRTDVMDCFGGKEAFLKFHQQPVAVKNLELE